MFYAAWIRQTFFSFFSLFDYNQDFLSLSFFVLLILIRDKRLFFRDKYKQQEQMLPIFGHNEVCK